MDKKTRYRGLSKEEVVKSRKEHGVNEITPPKREPLWRLFLDKFNDPIIRILLIAALLSLGISFVNMSFAETIGIFFAIFLATAISFGVELDANKKFDILNKVNDDTLYKVIRDGVICEVPKKDIVVGEVVFLETGEEVPADGELAEAVSLQIDESCLTGEPSIDKTTNPAYFQKEATYPSNWAMRGTKILNGHAVMLVVMVGDQTEFGKVASESTKISTEETPLNKQLDRLAKYIGVVGFLFAFIIFFTLVLKDLLFGNYNYSAVQLVSISIILFSAFIALAKIWLPIIQEALLSFSKRYRVPDWMLKRGWPKWLLVGFITFIVLSTVAYIFGVNILDTNSWLEIEVLGKVLSYFMIAVTLIVVSVPEGLPMSVTLSLALSMRRMLKNNNLVRKMHACETMGATTVICTDKTGTLTQNQMEVYKADFYALESTELYSEENANLINESIAINTTAHLERGDAKSVRPIGNPTEGALLLWLHNKNIDYLAIRQNSQILEQITFSTERKYMATLAYSPSLKKKILYVKGAPEIILAKCNRNLTYNIEETLTIYQKKAMRTLAFAYKVVEEEASSAQEMLSLNDLVLLGVVAIADPIREEVPSAVAQCLKAGIEIKIVTGDTQNTAVEIGRQIGIWQEDDEAESIITGVEFENLSENEALERVKVLKIMCRARPTDKLRLVQLLQKNNHVVAVTGDGTNDAPALNFAHIGLSMGSGTSVAKEASDITLLDDSFGTIVSAVMWGRSLYLNIQRFLVFQLTINVVAVAIVTLGSLFGKEIPLTITQMLWVNLIMDTFAAAALASIPPDKKVLNEKPRDNSAFIVTKAMRNNIIVVSLLFIAILVTLLLLYINPQTGLAGRYNLTKFFTIFVMLQFWNMFNAKAFASGRSAFTKLNKSFEFLVVAAIILVGQMLIVQFGGEVFRTVPLNVKDWIAIICGTSIILWVGEIARAFSRYRKR